MGTVICPLLLMVLEGGIFTSYLESKDIILYQSRQSALTGFARTSTFYHQNCDAPHFQRPLRSFPLQPASSW
jgi:hypothetical protein